MCRCASLWHGGPDPDPLVAEFSVAMRKTTFVLSADREDLSKMELDGFEIRGTHRATAQEVQAAPKRWPLPV